MNLLPNPPERSFWELLRRNLQISAVIFLSAAALGAYVAVVNWYSTYTESPKFDFDPTDKAARFSALAAIWGPRISAGSQYVLVTLAVLLVAAWAFSGQPEKDH